MSKFRKHTIEEMQKRSKMRKQRKKLTRKLVNGVGHSSTYEEQVGEGTANFENGQTNEEKGRTINCIKEDKIDYPSFNGNPYEWNRTDLSSEDISEGGKTIMMKENTTAAAQVLVFGTFIFTKVCKKHVFRTIRQILPVLTLDCERRLNIDTGVESQPWHSVPVNEVVTFYRVFIFISVETDTVQEIVDFLWLCFRI